MQKRLAVEYERWQQYLDTPTRKPLISIVEQQLLAAHMPAMLEKGFNDLMTQKRSVKCVASSPSTQKARKSLALLDADVVEFVQLLGVCVIYMQSIHRLYKKSIVVFMYRR